MRTLSLFLALFILAPVLAHAADVTITCSPPTQFVDGSPIPSTAVITFKIYSGTTALDTQPVCKFVRTGLLPNTYNYTATATIGGLESDQSAPVQIVVPPPAVKPNPPGTPTATIAPTSPTAYSVIKSQDALVMLPVGKTNAMSCDLTQAVQSGGQIYRPVPTASVTFTGTARPIVTFAICS